MFVAPASGGISTAVTGRAHWKTSTIPMYPGAAKTGFAGGLPLDMPFNGSSTTKRIRPRRPPERPKFTQELAGLWRIPCIGLQLSSFFSHA